MPAVGAGGWASPTAEPPSVVPLLRPPPITPEDEEYETRGSMERIAGSFSSGILQDRALMEAKRYRQTYFTERDPLALANYRDMMQRVEAYGESGPDVIGWLQSGAQIAGQMTSSMQDPRVIAGAAGGALTFGAYGVMGGGPLMPLTATAGAITGFGIGVTAGLAAHSYDVEASGAFIEYLDAGMEPHSAMWTSSVVGVVNAALETGGTAAVLAPFKGLAKKVIKDKIAAGLQAYALAIGGEVTTEALQELTTIAGREIQRRLGADEIKALTPEQILERVGEVALETFKGMVLLAGPGAGTAYVTASGKATRAEDNRKKLKEIVERAKTLPPETAAATTETSLVVAGVKETFIEAQRLVEVANASPDPAGFYAGLGLDGAQITAIEDSAMLGGDVRFSPTQLTTVMLKEEYPELLDHVRPSQDEASAAEAKEARAEFEAAMAAALPEVAEEEGAAAAPGATFTTAKGSTYTVNPDGTTTRNKAFRPEHGEKEQGPQPQSEVTFYVTPEDAQKLGEFQTSGPKKSIERAGADQVAVKYLEGPGAGKFERRTLVDVQREPAVGLIPVEMWKGGTRVHFGNEIVSLGAPAGAAGAAATSFTPDTAIGQEFKRGATRATYVEQNPDGSYGFDLYQGDLHLGRVDLRLRGDALQIENVIASVTATEQAGRPVGPWPSNVLGPGKIRETLDLLSDMFPTAQRLTGDRVSGARFRGDYVAQPGERRGQQGVEVDIPLKRRAPAAPTVAEAEMGLQALFKTAAEAGMTTRQYEKYLVALQRAVDTRNERKAKRVLKSELAALRGEEAALRAQLAITARESVSTEPLYAALLGIGRDKLDYAKVVDIIGEEGIKRLPRVPGRVLKTVVPTFATGGGPPGPNVSQSRDTLIKVGNQFRLSDAWKYVEPSNYSELAAQTLTKVMQAVPNVPVFVLADAQVQRISRGAIGFYSSGTGELVLSDRLLNFEPYITDYVIFHEAMHAATVKGIDKSAQNQALAKKLLAEVKLGFPPDKQKTYGLTDIYELIAEAHSNHEFQTALQNIEISDALANELDLPTWKKHTTWDGIIALIGRILGLGRKHFTAIEAVFGLTEQYMFEYLPGDAKVFADRVSADKQSKLSQIRALFAKQPSKGRGGPGTLATTQAPMTFQEKAAAMRPPYKRWADIIDELDAREFTAEELHARGVKNKDGLYRSILSTASKEPLKRGETWRGRVIRFIEKAWERETKAGPGTLATTQEPPPVKPSNESIVSRKGTEGIDPDLHAEQYGIEGGDIMLFSMIDLPRFEAAVATETERLFNERYHGMTTRQRELELEIQDLHNNSQAAVLAMELNALRVAIKGNRLKPRALRAAARDLLRDMKLKDIKPKKFLRIEQKEAKRAAQLLRKGDRKGAAEAKFRQLVNFQMSQDAYGIVEKTKAQHKYFKKFLKMPKPGGKLPMASWEAIVGLLGVPMPARRRATPESNVINLGRPRSIEKIKSEYQLAEGIALLLAIEVSKGVPNHYLEATLGDWETLHANVKAVEKQGLDANKFAREEEKRTRDEAGAELAAMIDAMPDKSNQLVETRWERVKDGLIQFGLISINADSIIRNMDAFKSLGTAWNLLKRPYVWGMSRGYLPGSVGYVRRMKEAAEKFNKIQAIFTASEMRQSNKPFVIRGVRTRMSRQKLWSVLFNIGNLENRLALTGTKERPGQFTDAEIALIVARADAKDIQFVNEIHAFIDSFWPEVKKVIERRMNVIGQRVEPTPTDTQHGQLTGGYFPLVYSTRHGWGIEAWTKTIEGDTAQALLDTIEERRTGRYIMMHTRDSHRQERKGSGGRSVKLNPFVILQHVNQVLYDIEMGDAIVDIYKALHHPDVREAFRRGGHQLHAEQLDLWLSDVAMGEVHHDHIIETAFRHGRNGLTIAALGYKVSVAMMQLLGVTQSAVMVGKRNMVRGILDWATNPRAAFAYARGQSQLMEQRAFTYNADLQEAQAAFKRSIIPRQFYDYAFYGIITMQGAVDVATWLAGKRQGMKMFDGDEQKAIEHADLMVIRTQGSSMLGERTQFERGTLRKGMQQTEVVRAFAGFISYFAAKHNVAYEKIKTTNPRDPIQVIDLAINLSLLYVWEALFVEAFIREDTPEDDDDMSAWAWWALSNTAKSAAGGVPLVRELVLEMEGFRSGGVVGAIGGQVYNFASQTVQGELDIAWAKSALKFAGTVFGIPGTGQAISTGEAALLKADYEDVKAMDFVLGVRGRE